VAKRVHIDAVRARRARPAEVGVIDVARMASPDDDVERMLTVRTVRHALMSLSPEHREVLVEVYYRERSVKEAAEVLGIPVGTVKSRTYYALRALRLAAAAAGLES
jgi:RNA polymerase sigma-70 factor (ECF subfamily)